MGRKPVGMQKNKTGYAECGKTYSHQKTLLDNNLQTLEAVPKQCFLAWTGIG